MVEENNFSYNDSKEKWYRIPERENRKWSVPKLPYGSWVGANRIIVRAGYLWSPMDMPLDLLEERINTHIVNTVNFYADNPARAKIMFSRHHPDKQLVLRDTETNPVEGTFTKEMIQWFLAALDVYGHDSFKKRLSYRIRGKWLGEKKRELLNQGHDFKELKTKTFWYMDVPFSGQTDGTVIRQCGLYNPPSQYDEYEYDPGGLAVTTVQKLLHLGSWWFKDFSMQGKFSHYKDFQIYIHPADIDWREDYGGEYSYICDEWEKHGLPTTITPDL